MQNIVKALQELKGINASYELSNSKIEEILNEAKTAKVCVPIIGKFSSGKSAMVNTLLACKPKLLAEDITPETAVPTELVYGIDEKIVLDKIDETKECKNISEIRNLELDASVVKSLLVSVNNKFLQEISDVMVVDMPGFESGYEIHNKAIDNYVSKSLAYIITFPADDMVVRGSVGDILKELCLHNMPLCVVITKYDKRNHEYEESLKNLKDNLKKYVGSREITFCTSSSFLGNADEVKSFLIDVQKDSQHILAKKFAKMLMAEVDATEVYLNSRIKASALTESELDEQEEKLSLQIEEVTKSVEQEKNDFMQQIENCAEEITADVQIALESETSTFVTMTMNNQSINEKVNVLVRSAVTQGLNRRFVPVVQRYLKRVSSAVSGDSLGTLAVNVDVNLSNGILDYALAEVSGIVAAIIVNPVWGVIVAAVVGILKSWRKDKKREEQKMQIRENLEDEVYPSVLKQVRAMLEDTIGKQVKEINADIDAQILDRKNILEKSLKDVREKLAEEKVTKEELLIALNRDLSKLNELKIVAKVG